MRMSVKLPLEAEAIGRADYLDFQRDTCWDMFGEKAVENYTENVLLIICCSVNLACGEEIFLQSIINVSIK